jgi:hypothetical protein
VVEGDLILDSEGEFAFDPGMSSVEVSSRRVWPLLDLPLFAGTLLAYAAALPLGLDRLGAARAIEQGYLLSAGAPAEGGAPLGALLIRLFAFFPFADVAARANLASAVAGAVAAVLLGRLSTEVLINLCPPAHARRTERDLWHEPVAAAAGAGVAALSMGLFLAATSAGAVALTTALVAGVWIRGVRVARAPEDTREGLWLAFLAGLALGSDPRAPAFVWPPAFLLWIWALRRGERWPLLAPVVAVAGGAVAFYVTVAADVPVSIRVLGERLALGVWSGPIFGPASAGEPGASGLLALGGHLTAELGVVAILVAVVGLLVLLLRAPLACALVLVSLAPGLLLAVGETREPGRMEVAGAAIALLVAAASVPLSVGIAYMAGKLGPARAAAAAVLAVTALAWPILEGGGRRWSRDGRVPARLLEHALAGAPPRSVVDPGTPEMAALLGYARALGLRPDLTIKQISPVKAD